MNPSAVLEAALEHNKRLTAEVERLNETIKCLRSLRESDRKIIEKLRGGK
jgi:FixJ family two-component response regulator